LPAVIVPAVQSVPRRLGPVPRWLIPSLSDCLFLAILVWVFALGSGWSVLLADGDTGWHIRTGEYILDTRSVPAHDLFSFSKSGQPWLAWEWGSDVIFGALHRAWGLKGVVVLSGVVLALSATLLFRSMLWRGANLLAALAATLLAAGASTVHYLARPHIFTFLGLTAAMWMLERDRRRPSRAVWWLVPMTALWTNLHGGFLAWLACVGLVSAGCAWGAAVAPSGTPFGFSPLRRYALLAGACAAATLVNPYGWRLHQHVISYLRSDWIRQAVEEFQSPRFRSESMLQFEILLFAGLAMVPVFFRQCRFADVLLVLFWAHFALVSARHVPLYAMIAAPLVAAEASRLWSAWSAGFHCKSVGGLLRDCLRDFSTGVQRSSIWVPVALVGLAAWPWDGPADFPGNKFPVTALERNASLMTAPRGAPRRILTSDQWGDYLIYRLYPRQRVFVDGRSDFYGPVIGRDYLVLLNGAPGWDRVVEQYRFDLALLPLDWPLAQLMMCHPAWQVRYQDRQAVVLERRQQTGLNQNPDSTERIHGEPTE